MQLKHAILATAIFFALPFSQPVMAADWTVDYDKSSLGFEVPQGGKTLKGAFENWTASIDFDVDALQDSLIAAEIETGSAKTGNKQFDGMLPSGDWFDASEFPTADFTSDNVMHIEGNRYKADGVLTIKSVTLPIELEFTLDITGDTAHAVGTATLKRKEYGLGPAVNADTVGETVTVTLDLTATR